MEIPFMKDCMHVRMKKIRLWKLLASDTRVLRKRTHVVLHLGQFVLHKLYYFCKFHVYAMSYVKWTYLSYVLFINRSLTYCRPMR